MIYSIKGKFIPDKMNEFYQKLTDGTIDNQEPDGKEIINSMRRAKITGLDLIQWSEMCFCSPPLKHERATVYDHYLTEMQIIPMDDYIEFEGESFFEFLEKQFRK